jgi:hypothetical protein
VWARDLTGAPIGYLGSFRTRRQAERLADRCCANIPAPLEGQALYSVKVERKMAEAEEWNRNRVGHLQAHVHPILREEPVPHQRSDEETAIVLEMITEGKMFCESNTWDTHKATRIGPDGYLYCDDHDENNH